MRKIVAAPERLKIKIGSLELSSGNPEAGGKYIDSNRVLGFDAAKLIETLGAAYERADRENLVIQIEIKVSCGYDSDSDIDIDAVTIYGYRDETEAEVNARVQAARLQFEAQQKVAAAKTAAFERAEYDRLKTKFEGR